MLRCGVKLTHDSAVAVIDSGKLLFSIENEKLRNNARYSIFTDLGEVDDILRSEDITRGDLDRVIIDGWRNYSPVRTVGGTRTSVPLAPYRPSLTAALQGAAPLQAQVSDWRYESYTHYEGHIMASYCTSTFARDQLSAYVLVWDGAMYPILYHVDPASLSVQPVTVLFHLIGDAYTQLGSLVEPFAAELSMGFPHTLGIAGKLMAYAGTGSPDDEALGVLDTAFAQADEYFSAEMTDEECASEAVGKLIIARMLDHVTKSCVLQRISAADWVASLETFFGNLLVTELHTAIDRDGHKSPRLCLSGGCALNIKWNSRLRKEVLGDIWVPPFPNDSGAAIGSACADMFFRGEAVSLEWTVFSGPALTKSQSPGGWTSTECDATSLAELLAANPRCTVTVLDGRAELGPRSLGHRSIVAAATETAMKDDLNAIKGRESYRPIAPICLADDAAAVFDPGTPDPFMLFDHAVRDEWRSRIPAVVHLDGTARLQTIDESQGFIADVLVQYRARTGIGVLCNTSANLKGSGFFPDLCSALTWGGTDYVWSDGRLWSKQV